MTRSISVNNIENPTNLQLEKLEQFVSSHTNGNFFQSLKAFQFFQEVENYQPFLFVALENDEIVGSLLVVRMQEGNGLKGYFSRRCIVWGGPLAIDENSVIYSALLDKLNEIASKTAIYSEFRNFSNQLNNKEIFKQVGFRLNEHLNFIVKTPSVEEAKAKLSNSKKRQINKSIKNGAQIIEAENIDQIKAFYGILSKLYKEKVKKPL
ncbi:MAG: hypothetical protein SCK70_11850, partial [bacterium]|nr:hypothetical protein [bacterium]